MSQFVIKTLGCKVNQSESESIAADLRGNGYTQLKPAFHDPPQRDSENSVTVCVINTCTVTEKASMQSRQAIRQAIRAYPEARIIVTGCYAQTQPGEINKIQGVHDIVSQKKKHLVSSLLLEMTPEASTTPADPWANTIFPERAMGDRTRAFLKIQDGCNAHCAYCIVPTARGRSRSMPEERVISSLSDLQRAGSKEVVLSGIHLGCYGLDLSPKRSLHALLERIESLGIIDRIRLSSIEPGELTDDIIDLVSNSKHFCRHFHIPLQSGDNDILRKMKRFYTGESFKDLILRIHKKIPDAAIGVDVLVGFPGETDGAFDNTFRLIESLPVSYLHVFPFSPRAGTPAFELPGKLHSALLKSRAARMRSLGEEKKRAFFDTLQGGTMEVLVERSVDSETGWQKGRTSNYVPVFLKQYTGVDNTIIRAKVVKRIGTRGVLAEPKSCPAPL